ncbi:sensor histidine kinase [Niveispirillum sp. KHB5.9]|uniref:sensor histidine kinase n=1 Tax=Niveispirillum sp. KHB5.9 TaxID=3400269 RepID=UPI003A852F8D
MGYRRFELNVTLRVAMLALSSMLLGIMLVETTYRATSFLVGLAILAQVGGLLRTVTKTNREVARFLGAIAHSDFSQTFRQLDQGSAFDELGASITQVMDKFRASRANSEKQADYLNAMLNQVPVALAAVYEDNRVELLNNFAHRLLGPEELSRRTTDGQLIADALRSLAPGTRTLIRVAAGTTVGPQQLTVTATRLILGGESRLLLSLQNIAGDLEATEVRAWQDLVRVLTHEMMNSLTPISSLTRTAQGVLADLKQKVEGKPELVEEMQDAEMAIDTVARRSNSLLRFVERYRQFTSVPKPQLSRIKVKEITERLQRLMAPATESHGVSMEVLVLPPQLELLADADMVEQILINLLKNAVEAMRDMGEARDGGHRIRLTAHLDEGGHVIVNVGDNGPGIASDVAEKIFIPFYTTKREGSGVGLSLARQVMLAHGGSINLTPDPDGGSVFTLRF